MLRAGLEAGDLDEADVAAMESRTRTGRPLGDERFTAAHEAATGRRLKPGRPGRRAR